MSFCFEEVEATVSEEVEGGESADFLVGGEGGFVDGVEYWTFFISGVAGHEVLLESRTNV